MVPDAPDYVGPFPLGLVRKAWALRKERPRISAGELARTLGLRDTAEGQRLLGVLDMRDLVEGALVQDDRRAVVVLRDILHVPEEDARAALSDAMSVPVPRPHHYKHGRCAHGCGATMGDFASDAPGDIDPFGDCPNWPGSPLRPNYPYEPHPPQGRWSRAGRGKLWVTPEQEAAGGPRPPAENPAT